MVETKVNETEEEDEITWIFTSNSLSNHHADSLVEINK